MTLSLTWADWLALFTHFASLSLLAVGGVIATAPDMHADLSARLPSAKLKAEARASAKGKAKLEGKAKAYNSV